MMKQKMQLQVLKAGGYSLNANKDDDELLLPPEVEREIRKQQGKQQKDDNDELLLPPNIQ